MSGDITGLLLGVVFWTFLGAIILVPIYFKYKNRARLHDTLRTAFERGTPIPPELISVLQSDTAPARPNTPESDLRRAVVLLAVGLGLGGLGYGLWYGLMAADQTAAYIAGACVAGAGAIPAMIGLAFLILWATRRNATKV